MQKKMFKVVSPIERPGGATWWMRCGTGYGNKDNSINIFLEALPLAAVTKGEGIKIQLRELTDEELRERAEKKATYAPRSIDPNGLPSMTPSSGGYGGHGARGGSPGAAAQPEVAGEPLPF